MSSRVNASQSSDSILVRIVVCGLVADVLVLAATAVSLAFDGGGLPTWFVAAFVIGIGALVFTLGVFGWQVATKGLFLPSGTDAAARTLLALIPLSIVLTSGLHAFYPFRLGVIERLESLTIPRSFDDPLLAFNYVFTAAAFVVASLLVGGFLLGRRRFALIGIAVTAVLLLFPNDNCSNAFNRSWNDFIDASPMMFAPASAVLLIAVCGLCRVWPSTSVWACTTICFSVSLVALGHLTRLVW